MKLLLWTDLHCHPFSQYAKLVDGVNSRFMEILAIFDQLEIVWKKYKPDEFLFCGDLTHVRNHLLTFYYGLLYDRISDFTNFHPGKALVGNHDQAVRGMPEYSSLKPLSRLMEVIDKPRILKLKSSVRLFGMPYIEDHRELRGYLKEMAPSLDKANYNILAGHFGVKGASYVGNEYEVREPLKLKHLQPDSFTRMFTGHYHKKQEFKHLTVIGSPVQHNHNDEGQKRGCVLLDTDTNETTFIPLSGPRFITLNLSSEKDFDIIKEDKKLRKSYVRCRIFGRSISEDQVSSFLSENSAGFRVKHVGESDIVEGKIAEFTELSDDKLLEKLLVGITTNTSRREKIKTLALNYLHQADKELMND